MSDETDCLGYWFQELLTDFVAVSAENAINCRDSAALVRSSELLRHFKLLASDELESMQECLGEDAIRSQGDLYPPCDMIDRRQHLLSMYYNELSPTRRIVLE